MMRRRWAALLLSLCALVGIPLIAAPPAMAVTDYGTPVMTCVLEVSTPVLSGGTIQARGTITCDGVFISNGTQTSRVRVDIFKYFGSGVWQQVAADGWNQRQYDGTVSAQAAFQCTQGVQHSFYAKASGSATDVQGTYTGIHYATSSSVTKAC